MWSAPSGCVVIRALVLAGLWLAVAGRPLARRSLALSDQGPHLYYGWDQPIRLRHLYAAGPYGRSRCFLRIHTDGAVDCVEEQSEHCECPQVPARSPPHPPPLSFLGTRGTPGSPKNPSFWHPHFTIPASVPRRGGGGVGHRCARCAPTC